MIGPSARFILGLGEDGAFLLPPRGADRTPALFTEGHDDSRVAPLLAALASRPLAPVLVLADTLGQGFHLSTLPPAGWIDRRRLLARRLRQAFPSGDLACALPRGPREALLAGLHEGGPVALWLERLDRLSNPVQGVALLPLEGAGILARLAPESKRGWGLLLSAQRTGGFRQIVTRDGAFVFTRLTPALPAGSSPAYVAGMLALDLAATRTYLRRLGLMEESSLTLVALLPPALRASAESLTDGATALLALTPAEAAQRLGVPAPHDPREPFADELYAEWIARHGVRFPLTRHQDKRLARRRRLQGAIRLAGLAAGATLALALVAQGAALLDDQRARTALREEIAALRREVAEDQARLAPVAEPLGRRRLALARKRLFESPHAVPWPLLAALRQGLGAKARLARLEWTVPESAAHEVDATLRLSLHLLDAPPLAPETIPDLRRAFDSVAADLARAFPAHDTRVTRYPFAALPEETIAQAPASGPTGRETETLASLCADMAMQPRRTP